MSYVINPFGFGGGGGGTYVTKVQHVSITIGSGSTSNTATITSVDTSKSFMILLGFSTTNSNFGMRHSYTRVTLTNGTTVTATRTGTTGNVTVNAVVVEATSALVSSVQYGTISIPNSERENTATITSVTTSRSAVIFLGTSGGVDDTGMNQMCMRTLLTNSTTVTADRAANGEPATVGFVVVEFQSAAIQSVQALSPTYTGTSTTHSETISSVTTGNTMLAYGGYRTDDADSFVSDSALTRQLTSSTNIDCVRTGTVNEDIRPGITVVEFVNGVLGSVQRGTISLQSATSNTATITSVNTTRSVCNFGGFRNAVTTGMALPSNIYMRVTLTNATTVTGNINDSNASAKNVGYEILEFN